MKIEIARNENWTDTLDKFMHSTELLLSKEVTNNLRLRDVGEQRTLPAFTGNSYTITRVE